MMEIARRGKGESRAFAPGAKLRKKIDLDAVPRKRCGAKSRRSILFISLPCRAGRGRNGAEGQNANDHESEHCAYIRRHPLKIVVAKTSAPCGVMLVLSR